MRRVDRTGPVALVGSGEFLEVMVPVDAELLAGRPQRVVFLPTAAAPEGPDRVRYWTDLATAHYASMGVEPVLLEVLDREDAERPELASRVAGTGLVYLSGGNPGYLAHTLKGTPVWQAITDAWRSGAALAGCSAGACALSRLADDFRRPGRYSGEGLAVAPRLVVLPHFDRLENWMPGLVGRVLARTPPDAALVGIDEETALICDGNSFTVRGTKSVWRIDPDGTRLEFRAGEQLELPATVPRQAPPRRRATHAT